MSSPSLAVLLFVSGVLTILLPCILPLIPIVLGVSIADRNPWRPLLTVLGMVVSFVGFAFLLQQVLSQLVQVADYLRIGTYYVLLLFGLGFLTKNKTVQILGAVLGGFFFWHKGWIAMTIAQTLGAVAMDVGTRVAAKIQQFGTDIQKKAGAGLGREHPATAFIIGLTMGLVWVPCAGPALGFAFALVREEPGLRALFFLSLYGLGTAVPLVIIGYGGQAAVKHVRVISRYSGRIKEAAGVLLILTAVALQYGWLRDIETYLVQKTDYGIFGTNLEVKLFGDRALPVPRKPSASSASSSERTATAPKLPRISRAPELVGLGQWFNSDSLTLQDLRGKVVLIDFWTYSCINCIRTLPYVQGYWDTFKDTEKFVLIGVHTPEFVFEKDPGNVADAIKRHKLTYPIVQDNDYATWNAFRNRFWPAKYLIDAEGFIRSVHFGEGAYEETGEAIESLLAEIGVQGKEQEEQDEQDEQEERENYGSQTPETYLGSRSWSALGNGSLVPTSKEVTYAAPARTGLHEYSLAGVWQMVDNERQVLRSEEGEIRMRFLGGEINLVLGMEKGSKPTVHVIVDGVPTQTFTVDRYDLFPLWKGPYGEHEIVLKIQGKGLQGYAFTFGG
jgi:cytochrome c biogenesis protein CcdA/thiol-disulfide isomerase/thioredoxin